MPEDSSGMAEDEFYSLEEDLGMLAGIEQVVSPLLADSKLVPPLRLLT